MTCFADPAAGKTACQDHGSPPCRPPPMASTTGCQQCISTMLAALLATVLAPDCMASIGHDEVLTIWSNSRCSIAVKCVACNNRKPLLGFRHSEPCLRDLSERAARWDVYDHPERCADCRRCPAELGHARCRQWLDNLQARQARRVAELRAVGAWVACRKALSDQG